MSIPKIFTIYNCYDDGKIRISRQYKVRVIKVIPFRKAPRWLVQKWKKVKYDFPWLWSHTTDYFVIARSYETEKPSISIFSRTIDRGWFSWGDWFDSGRLDVDGKLTKQLQQ